MELFQLTYLGLFGASFLAATIVPFSSEVLFLALYLEGFDPVILVVVASIGNWLGGLSSYILGFFGKEKWLTKYFGVDKNKAMRFSRTIKKYGAFSALLCWLPFIGDVIAVALGFFKVKVLPVAVLMFLGKMLRYLVIIYFVY